MSAPRPNKFSPEIIRQTANELARQIKSDWLRDDTPVEDIIKDLEPHLRWDRDGYKLAKSIDGYDPDAQLVEILDQAAIILDRHHQAALIAWVAQTQSTAPEIGSLVTCDRHKDSGVGEIITNYPDGRSTVCFPLLGHQKTTPSPPVSCTRGFLINWEDLIPAGNPSTPPTPP